MSELEAMAAHVQGQHDALMQAQGLPTYESLRQQNAELVRALQFALESFDPQTEAFSQPRRKPLLQMIRAILATVQA